MPISRSNSTDLLLVEMPFKAVNRPSIGLSLLKAASVRAGFSCEIHYANLPFAERIGFDLYETIAEQLPPESLFGDLIFQLNMRDGRGAGPSVESLGFDAVPSWLWKLLPELQREAACYIDEVANHIVRAGFRHIGLSSMFQLAPNLSLARAIKNCESSCIIVMGGACCEGEMGLTVHEEFPWVRLHLPWRGRAIHRPTTQPPRDGKSRRGRHTWVAGASWNELSRDRGEHR